MGRKYLGDHICVITKNKNASQSHNGLIIFAHGGQLVSETFDLDGGTVWFYAPDGATLLENMYGFIRSRIVANFVDKVTDTGGTTKCPNYALTKSLSYHQSEAKAKLGKQKIAKALKADPAEAEGRNLSDYKHLEGLVTGGDCKYDIVSIRNRWFSDGTTFAAVLKKLKKEGYAYGDVHCYFCRSSPVNPPVWDVELKQYA